MNTLQTILGFDSSQQAKFRFHVLKVYYKGGWDTVHLAFPNLKRPTLYRWKKQYEDSGKKLNSLVPKSTKPHSFRQPKEHLAVTKLIKQLRVAHPRMGKAKIEQFVKVLVSELELGNIPSSQATIGRLIKRKNYFFAGKDKVKGKRVRGLKKQRIKLCPKSGDVNPGYIQLDGVKFHYLGRYYYFLTAVDIVTKQAWVKLVTSFKSQYASEFLKEIIQSAWYTVHTIQTDNGSEFELFFEEAVKASRLNHLFSYPKHPKTNGYVERFNWTVQDEFLHSYEDMLLYPADFLKELTNWLIWYNHKRPHQSLKYLSPYQYLKERRLSQKY
jgi:putative transposase